MKKKLFLGAVMVLAVFLVCFGLLGFDIQNEEEVDPAIAQAQAKTAQFVDMVYRAHFTGDMSELKEYLEQKDTDGIVRNLMKKNRIRLDTPRVRRMQATGGTTLPFGEFSDQTILLSATKGSIIFLVIPGMYTHCGSLDFDKYNGDDLDQGCIITANLDGVTYETPSEWNSGVGIDKMVSRLEPNNELSGLNWAQNSIMRWYQGWTIYSFLKLNLDPVSRWGPWRWYCSKTVWRVFKKAGLNVENTHYYDNPNIVSNIMDNSLLFQLYKGLLIKLGIDPETAHAMAYEKLINALDECITPDEIRFSGNLSRIFTWGGTDIYP